MGDIVQELSTYIEEEPVHFHSLFENVVSSVAEREGKKIAARKAAAYLLLNQIVFYHVLSKEGHVPEINEKSLKIPTQLFTEYFRPVTDSIDYHAIFDFDVASLFPKKANKFIIDLVRNIKELAPEDFTRNLLGSIFHRLIPQEIRKPLAAYYTNPTAASLLAKLAIGESSLKVADFACGSGTLLVAAYNRKAELSKGGETTEAIHKRFIEKELTGIDVMPFAAHLAVVQLALKNPGYMTDKVRVGVWDSTLLNSESNIDPIHAMMPVGQRKMADYQEENFIRLKKKQGAISGRGVGSSFTIGKCDIVLMNPPFSRKQNITKELRVELEERFKEYSDYITAEQNYNVYFIYLADRFLKNNGKIAMVIPATMLKQKSSKGFRRFIMKKYNIDFVILNEFRSAFSEDTSFRDMLFIASKKDESKQSSAVFAMLKVLPSTDNGNEICETLTNFYSSQGQQINTALLKAVKISQNKLRTRDDWYKLLPDEVDKEYSDDYSRMTTLNKIAIKVIQGFRYEKNSEFVSTKDTLVSIPRERKVRIDNEVLQEDSVQLLIQNPNSAENLIIPKKSTFPAIRTASWQKSMKIQHPMDFVILERFAGDDNFWSTSDVDSMLVRRREHIETRKANLIMAGYGNIDISAPGTFFLAFCSKIPIAPTWSFWSLPCLKYEHAFVMALWLNSTFALSNLLKNRTEVRGTNIKWRKSDIEKLPVIDINQLSKEEIEEAQGLFNELNKLDFPCLIDQLENSFEGRLKIDLFFAKKLNMEISEKTIIELQKGIAVKLRKMQKMMQRD